jgi:hypothetical protein
VQVQVTSGTPANEESAIQSLDFREKTLKETEKKQSGPLHQTERRKLKQRPSSPVPGTTPLGTERKGNAAGSSKKGLHMEVEEASAIAGFKRDHQLVI